MALLAGVNDSLSSVVAAALATAGATAVICSPSAPRMSPAAAEMRAQGLDVHAVACDVLQHYAVNRAVYEVVDSRGPVDILVNHISSPSTVASLLAAGAGWTTATALALSSAYLLTYEVASRCMLPRRSGHIVTLSEHWHSEGADQNERRLLQDAQIAVERIARQLAREWADRGVRFGHVKLAAPSAHESAGQACGPKRPTAGDTVVELLTRRERGPGLVVAAI